MRVFQIIFFIFFFLLPFHAFGVTFLNSIFFDVSVHPPFFLSGWKEVFLLLFFLFSAGVFLWNWKRVFLQIDTLDWLIVFFSLFTLWVGFFTSPSLFQAILGVKYDLFFLWIFWCVRHLSLLFPHFLPLKTIETAVLYSGIGIVGFALLQQFIPHDFLVQFGYFADPSVDTTEKPASFCQLLEGTDICRLQSFLAGPIRLGAFLVLFSAVLLRSSLRPVFRFSLLFLTLWALFFTYSRAAWIAESLLLIFFVAQHFQISFFSKKIIIGGIVTLSLFFTALWLHGDMDHLLIREGSSSKHWEGFTKSIETVIDHPMGIGLGMAGPASTHLGEDQEFLNENWYLQIFTELGIVGGILFMLICFCILKRIYQVDRTFFALTFSLMVMACFTHVWEEASVAYVLWAMMGVASIPKLSRFLKNKAIFT